MASLLFTGCDSLNKLTSDGKSEQWGSCDDNSTFSAMQDTIRKSFEDKAKTEGLSVSEARAFYSQLKITVDQVRTTKNDPSSTKKFCSGRINISIPVPILQKLEEKYKKANSSELRKAIEDGRWEVNANVISTGSDFDVQPSDDKKWLFTTLTQADVISSELSVLASWDQYRDKVFSKTNAITKSTGLLSKVNINSFIETLLQDVCFESIRDVSTYYTKNVKRFYSFVNPTHKMLYDDRTTYCQKYTFINYTLNSIDIVESGIKNGKEYVKIVVNIGYDIANDSKNLSGSTVQKMTLVVEDGEIKTESVSEQIIKEKK
jgi:hypothetical protein